MTTDKGFLKYKDVCFPYLFENDKLFLFPPNEDTWKRNTKSLIDSLNDLYNPDRKVQFIPQITLAAQSFSGKQVEFRIPEDFSNDNGFLSVDVISYYEYEDFTRHYTNTDEGKKVENTKNEICGFFLEGREIDYFLEAHQTFTTKLQFDENKSSLSSLTVESKKEKELICGEATLDGITITITANRYASFTNQALYPLEAKSRLVFQFDKPVDIEYIHNLYYCIRKCFIFLCNRKNVSFENLCVFSIYKDQRNKFGELHFTNQRKPEESKKLSERIIKLDAIKDHFGILLQKFIDNKVYLTHIPNSFAECSKYAEDRIIFTCVAFDRTFSELFPEDKIRSQDYIEVKELVLKSIGDLINTLTGKRRKKATGIKKTIEKLDTSFQDRFEKAIEMYKDIMTPFVERMYGPFNLDVIESCAERLNDLRNAFAHGNTNYGILPEHTLDLRLTERLLYAMILSNIGIDNSTVISTISSIT